MLKNRMRYLRLTYKWFVFSNKYLLDPEYASVGVGEAGGQAAHKFGVK